MFQRNLLPTSSRQRQTDYYRHGSSAELIPSSRCRQQVPLK
jgi:hypothetical protein